MKLKALAVATTALALAACGKTLLWKTTIADAATTGTPLAVVTDATNSTYQLYPIGTALQLRKLDADGVQLWTTPVDDSVVDSTGASALELTSTGVAVGYGTSTTQAFVKTFDANGLPLWNSDLGTHTAEAIADMVVGSDDSVTVAIKQSSAKTNTLRVDSTGNLLWDKTMPTCSLNLFCASSLALNSDGLLLQSVAELSSTKAYLIDTAGTTLWTKSRSTGISLSGIAANPVTPTANGFIITHAFVTWEYDLSGTQLWSVAYGGTTAVDTDASGNLYVANGTKVSKLDSVGTLLLDIPLDNQLAISQIDWRDDVQRLVILSQYSNQDSIIIGKITLNVGASLWVFDKDGKEKAKYSGTPTASIGDACDPFPSCTTVETSYGDQWSSFATTSNKMIVLSGMIKDTERYATAYNLK